MIGIGINTHIAFQYLDGENLNLGLSFLAWMTFCRANVPLTFTTSIEAQTPISSTIFKLPRKTSIVPYHYLL